MTIIEYYLYDCIEGFKPQISVETAAILMKSKQFTSTYTAIGISYDKGNGKTGACDIVNIDYTSESPTFVLSKDFIRLDLHKIQIVIYAILQILESLGLPGCYLDDILETEKI